MPAKAGMTPINYSGTFMKKPLILTGVLLLAGCSGSYSFHSNLNEENFKEYFKAGDVKVFHTNALPTQAYEPLGLVTGEACQLSSSDKIATEADARTAARKKAADLGANGLIIRSCATLNESNACLSHVLCSGQAIKLDE